MYVTIALNDVGGEDGAARRQSHDPRKHSKV